MGFHNVLHHSLVLKKILYMKVLVLSIKQTNVHRANNNVSKTSKNTSTEQSKRFRER